MTLYVSAMIGSVVFLGLFTFGLLADKRDKSSCWHWLPVFTALAVFLGLMFGFGTYFEMREEGTLFGRSIKP